MSKISELTDGGSLLPTDFLIAVRSGANVKVQADQADFDRIRLGDNEKIELGNSQDLTLVHTATQSIINQAGTGDLLLQKAGTTKASITANGLEFPDNAKAIFGAGSDLQIYHDGSHSYVKDVGTGYLYVGGSAYALIQGGSYNCFAAANTGEATIYYQGNPKLATTATGIDVTGTVTADGLTVDGGNSIVLNAASTSDYLELRQDTATAIITAGNNSAGSGAMALQSTSGGTAYDRLGIAANGDISFYEDTGTTPKLFWDASAERLGLGTTTPAGNLHIEQSGTNPYIRITETGNTGIDFGQETNGNGIINLRDSADLRVFTSATERMRIPSSGGIDITNGSVAISGDNYVYSYSGGSSGQVRSGMKLEGSTNTLEFYTNSAEAMRIDASGNLLVGKTAANFTVAGHEIKPASFAGFTRDGGSPVVVNRLTTDGNLIEFYQGVSSVGSIGSSNSSSVTYLAGSASGGGIGVANNSPAVFPARPAGVIDDTINLGSGFYRFKNLYLSGVMAAGDGSVTAPSVRGTDTNTGLFFPSGGVTAIARNGIEGMRMNASGNLLVGRTSEGATGNGHSIRGGDSAIFSRASTGETMAVCRDTSDGDFIRFKRNNLTIGTIAASGSTTSYNTSSDQRLKENIADADDAGAKIDAIQVRKYDWKADGSHQDYGMVAQELQAVAPEAVSGDPDSDEMMGVDYSKLVPMMLKEIQSLRARIAALES